MKTEKRTLLNQADLWDMRRALKVCIDLQEAKEEGKKTIKLEDVALEEINKNSWADLHDLMEDLRWELKTLTRRAVVTVEDGHELPEYLEQGDDQ